MANEALVDQGPEGVEVRLADLFRRGERKPACEQREPREEALLCLVEELIAPGDGVAECALPVRKVARARAQHWQALPKAFEERVGRQDLHPCGRKLERER